MRSFNREELIELAEAAIEGISSPEQLSKLERLVLEHESARRIYAEYVGLSAALRIAHGAPVPHFSTEHGLAGVAVRPVASPALMWPIGVLAVAVSLGLAVSLWSILWSSPARIATLVETKGCMWGSGTLPTEKGAALTQGRLRLKEGLAHIVFASGAELRLESPADLELVSPMKCIVRTGKLVAHVPPSAKGFVVETPFSVVTDFGTDFGVSVGSDQSALVQVFQGRVDTMHRRSGKTETMYEGASLHFGEKEYGHYGELETPVSSDEQASRPRESADWIQISTARGRGREMFVMPQEIPLDDRETGLVLVKRPYPEQVEWERRAYIGFDLEELSGKQVIAAELSLSFAPTGLGFSSQLPDAVFHLYGLKDCDADAWSEAELSWGNAPAGQAIGEPLDETKLDLLGSFTIPQGQQSATVVVDAHALVDFLNADSNQLATVIVARETAGIGLSDLVHGFAGRRHPSLSPPTLRLVLSDKKSS